MTTRFIYNEEVFNISLDTRLAAMLDFIAASNNLPFKFSCEHNGSPIEVMNTTHNRGGGYITWFSVRNETRAGVPHKPMNISLHVSPKKSDNSTFYEWYLPSSVLKEEEFLRQLSVVIMNIFIEDLNYNKKRIVYAFTTSFIKPVEKYPL